MINKITSLLFEKIVLDFGFKSKVENGLNSREFNIGSFGGYDLYSAKIVLDNTESRVLISKLIQSEYDVSHIIFDVNQSRFVLTGSDFFRFDKELHPISYSSKLVVAQVFHELVDLGAECFRDENKDLQEIFRKVIL